MADQLDFLDERPEYPDGFQYQRELITEADEIDLVAGIRVLPFKEFEFHGFVGKRRTVSYGWSYDFSRQSLEPADDVPQFLHPVRRAAASFAGLGSEQLKQVLVTEYGPNASIGWHRDKGVFGDVIGVSLLSACPFRFRRKRGTKWERVTVNIEPRSVYLLRGPARTEWEHSIPPVDRTRYSITFRTLR